MGDRTMRTIVSAWADWNNGTPQHIGWRIEDNGVEKAFLSRSGAVSGLWFVEDSDGVTATYTSWYKLAEDWKLPEDSRPD